MSVRFSQATRGKTTSNEKNDSKSAPSTMARCDPNLNYELDWHEKDSETGART